MRGLSQTRLRRARMTVGAWRGPVGWYSGSHHLTPHPCFQSKVFSLNRVQLTPQTDWWELCPDRPGEVLVLGLGLISDSWNNYGAAEFRIHVQHKWSTGLFNWYFESLNGSFFNKVFIPSKLCWTKWKLKYIVYLFEFNLILSLI